MRLYTRPTLQHLVSKSLAQCHCVTHSCSNVQCVILITSLVDTAGPDPMLTKYWPGHWSPCAGLAVSPADMPGSQTTQSPSCTASRRQTVSSPSKQSRWYYSQGRDSPAVTRWMCELHLRGRHTQALALCECGTAVFVSLSRTRAQLSCDTCVYITSTYMSRYTDSRYFTRT
jgi:hypothetical protein